VKTQEAKMTQAPAAVVKIPTESPQPARGKAAITVYPPQQEGGRWQAVWHEDGERRQRESVSEEKLAPKLEKVRERLATGASNMLRPGRGPDRALPGPRPLAGR
jgi:hypothetical protein